MQARPEVSIVLPTRDRWHLLDRTVAGALRQDGVSVEVVVVADGSREPAPATLALLADPRVRLLQSETSRGVSGARNRGIRESRAEWVAFLDDDDLWSPHKLRLQLDALRRTGAGAAFGAAVLVDGDLRPMDIQRVDPGADLETAILSRPTVPAGSSNVIASAALLRDVGYFDEQLNANSDWDMWIRLKLRTAFASIPEVVVAYVHHSGNMSIGQWDRFNAELATIDRKHAAERAKRGVTLDGLGFNRWLAGEQRRGGDRRGAIRTYARGAVKFRSPGNAVRAVAVPFERLVRHRVRRPGTSEAVDWLDLYRPGIDCRR